MACAAAFLGAPITVTAHMWRQERVERIEALA